MVQSSRCPIISSEHFYHPRPQSSTSALLVGEKVCHQWDSDGGWNTKQKHIKK